MMVHGVGWTSPRESGQEVSLMVLYRVSVVLIGT